MWRIEPPLFLLCFGGFIEFLYYSDLEYVAQPNFIHIKIILYDESYLEIFGFGPSLRKLLLHVNADSYLLSYHI